MEGIFNEPKVSQMACHRSKCGYKNSITALSRKRFACGFVGGWCTIRCILLHMTSVKEVVKEKAIIYWTIIYCVVKRKTSWCYNWGRCSMVNCFSKYTVVQSYFKQREDLFFVASSYNKQINNNLVRQAFLTICSMQLYISLHFAEPWRWDTRYAF